MKDPESMKLTKPSAIAESKNEPTGGKRAVLENEEEPSNDQPAAKGLIVEDEGWIAFEDARFRVKEALGIDEFLGHANDQALGVKAMTPLFAVP